MLSANIIYRGWYYEVGTSCIYRKSSERGCKNEKRKLTERGCEIVRELKQSDIDRGLQLHEALCDVWNYHTQDEFGRNYNY